MRSGAPVRTRSDPVFAGYPVADGVTGIDAAFAALLALHQRDLTGEPQLADIGLYEPLLRMMEDFIVDYDVAGRSVGRQGSENPHTSPNNLYRTRDGHWLALSASTEQMWQRLVMVMDADDLAAYGDMSERIRHRKDSEARVGAFVGAYDLDTLMNVFVAAGVVAGPVKLGRGHHRRPAHSRAGIRRAGHRRRRPVAPYAGTGRGIFRL